MGEESGPDGQRAGALSPPWTGKPRTADLVCWAALSLSGVYYLALVPARPELIGTHPVLLELLTGGTEGIVAAAAFASIGRGTLAVVLLAAVPGLMKFDILYWWAGRLWGQRVIGLLSGHRRRWLALAERARGWDRRLAWPAIVLCRFLPVPGLVYALAGWAGIRLAIFLVLDLAGALIWAGLLTGLGLALGRSAVDVAVTISRYGLWLSLGLAAAVVASQVWRLRRARRATPGG